MDLWIYGLLEFTIIPKLQKLTLLNILQNYKKILDNWKKV
jgi:hypothetical protein